MSTNRGLFRLSLSEEVNYIIYNIYQKNEKYQIIHVCGMHTFFGSVWQANREDYDSAGCVKSCFVWCGAVIADEIGTTGQAHNVMNNILSQKAANADKLTGKEPGNIRYIGTALGTLTIHGKQTTVRFIVVTADAEDPQHPRKA